MNGGTNNPMAEYLLKLQLIVTNTEFKDSTEAAKYETMETKLAGGAYVRAILKTDAFENYNYTESEIFSVMEAAGYKYEYIVNCIKYPQMIPGDQREILMQPQRELLIANYVEMNPYYQRLSGKPFVGSADVPPDKVVTIPQGFYEMYSSEEGIMKDMPIHQLSSKYIELFMNSAYYQEVLSAYPNLEYLKHLGSKAVPIEVSRTAKDGDIMKMNTSKMATYHPTFGNVAVTSDIINKYVNIYNKTRDYIYFSLRGDFSSFYANYDSLIRFLTIYMSIGNALNVYMKESANLLSMNNSTMNNFFMLYGLPSVIMEGNSAGEFLKNLRMLLMDKGTNVVYRVKDLIGYKYTDIYTLVMVKQQVFSEGVPIYKRDPDTGKLVPEQEIIFRRLGTTDDNTSYFKFKESRTTYSLHEITSGDPRWWGASEVDKMLQDMNYTLSNSKYIQLSTHLSFDDIWWQSVILLRGILDNRNETKNTMLNINMNINGKSNVSLFDAVLMLIILMDWAKGISGELYTNNGMHNGVPAIVDMLYNGLYQGILYESNTVYTKGTLVGLSGEQLYLVQETYTSSDAGDPLSSIEQDVENGYLVASQFDDGCPVQLKPGSPFKVSSFNFEFRGLYPEYYQSLQDMKFLEPDVFLPMLDRVLDRETIGIADSLMHEVRSIYEYIENKVREARNITEYRQISELYNKLFLVDPKREWYDSISYTSENATIQFFNMTSNEYTSLLRFYYEYPTDAELSYVDVTYLDHTYRVPLYDILAANAAEIEIDEEYPFTDNDFVEAFNLVMDNYVNKDIENSDLPQVVRTNYREIIKYKTLLDVNNTAEGPKTFEALLIREDMDLYRYLLNMKNSQEETIVTMRSIMKAIESLADAQLSGLEYTSLGQDNYFKIIKDVITYFKSYMVEFAKEEFVYMFGGILDNGGNPDWLHLYDETAQLKLYERLNESSTLYDAGMFSQHTKFADENMNFIYDGATFRLKGKYSALKNTDYDLWYDDGNRITQTPFAIDDDTEVTGDLFYDKDDEKNILIIHVNNVDVIPPNYYGNVR